MGKGFQVVVVRDYDPSRDLKRVEELEKSCEVGSLLVDLMGDPLARIRQSPSFYMLVRLRNIYTLTFNGLICSFSLFFSRFNLGNACDRWLRSILR